MGWQAGQQTHVLEPMPRKVSRLSSWAPLESLTMSTMPLLSPSFSKPHSDTTLHHQAPRVSSRCTMVILKAPL